MNKSTGVRSAVTRLLWLESSPYVGNSRITALPGTREGVHRSLENALGVRTGPFLVKTNAGNLSCSGYLAWHASTHFLGVCREKGDVGEQER